MRIVAKVMAAGLAVAAAGVAGSACAADAPARAGGVPVSDLRLRATGAVAATPGPLDAVRSRLRRRSASPMIDFYPVAGRGFHLSAGSRLHQRRNFAADAEKATGGLLFAPRSTAIAAARGGVSRFAPVVTLGYTRSIGGGVSLGVEGGARMGRAFSGMSRTLRPDRAQGGGASALVNVVLGYGF